MSTEKIKVFYQLTDYKSIARQLAQQLQTTWQENHYPVPLHIGRGIVEAYSFDHFSLMLSKFKMERTVRIERHYSPLKDYIALDYILNGISDIYVNEQFQQVTQLIYGVYFSSPCTVAYTEFAGNVQHDHLSILINKTWLETYFNQKLPEVLQNLNEPFNIYFGIKNQLIPTLALLIKSQPNTRFRKQYFEGKLLEIISLTFESILQNEEQRSRQSFHPDDVNTIVQAAGFIQQNIAQHTTIEDLARTFHINRDKLQTIFKSIYGKTIAEYARYVRMNSAYQLLLKRMTVAEVGHQLGYQNMSHFSRAFKKVHGINPSEILKTGT